MANALGRKFVEPPVLDLGETLGDSTPLSPLIFVLSAGVDPTQILRKLALERGMGSKFFTVALGQGQVSAIVYIACHILLQTQAPEPDLAFACSCYLHGHLSRKQFILSKLSNGASAQEQRLREQTWCAGAYS